MKLKVTNDNFSDLLLKSLNEAKKSAQGKITLKSELKLKPQDPPEYNKSKVKKIREMLNCSQAYFAQILNVSSATVRSWELGDNRPSRSSARLLQILEKDPEHFIKSVVNQ